MPTYAAYLRVSSDEQRERQTIKTQLEVINNYARANNIRIKHVFADDGISGSIPINKRPEGSRLLDKAESRAFDTLLVFRMDRISRDALEMLRTFKHLEQQGVVIKSVTEPFDTTDPAGKLFITVLGGMAQLEKDALKSRSFSGMKRGAGEGRWMGGRAPFGYKIQDGKLVINEVEAKIVREAFEMYLTGSTTQQIADVMNARNIPVPAAWRNLEQGKGARWRDATSHKLLRNESYTGVHRWNKRRTVTEEGERLETVPTSEREQITLRTEAIISTEDFQAVQRRLTSNMKFSRRNGHREYTLRGLVYCGDCGFLCVGGGGEWAAYSCLSSRRRAGVSCARTKIHAEELESQVWDDLVDAARHPENVISVLRSEHRKKKKLSGAKDREAELLRLINGTAEERAKVLRAMRKELISEDEAETQLREIEQEQEALEYEREKVRHLIRSSERLEQSLNNISRALESIRKNAKRATPKQQGEMLRSIIDRIIVSSPANGETELRVEIKYLLPES
jgi:site-specific DNA recombinase